MSKATLAVIAAASAATGAGVTALLYSSKSSSSSSSQTQTSSPQQQGPPPPSIAGNVKVPTAIPTPALAIKAVALDGPVNPAGILQYGFPGPIADELSTRALHGGYDRRTRNPAWVAEHITPQSLAMHNADRKHSTFAEDTSIPALFRAKLADYFRSGYDRGHQVPAADAKWSQGAMDDTFYLSNMCPQVGEGFNRDYWAHFEDFCRKLATRYPSVRVVTGPMYLPHRDPDGKWRVNYEVIGTPPNVAVPTHFYKVIYAEDGTDSPTSKVALGAFVLPNARIPNEKSLSDFEVPLEAVERSTGLEFAAKLDPSRRRRLCQEIKCDIVVREFNNARKRN
ncbi:DNA/RNA non-specific endonuclease family protein [Penicillium ucsense]|uniref:Endonuclease n=1 Tax=Penicillium ucsense TaxID=2839758 RepID=A0A8J8WHE9_9EURO|nr:DNA/RNA non-specific endonuclease family protein [Penicillium ucsense]KAF7734565.1 DNA/RNA non-specific endonuclease family protein [Penicillium ucsense]